MGVLLSSLYNHPPKRCRINKQNHTHMSHNQNPALKRSTQTMFQENSKRRISAPISGGLALNLDVPESVLEPFMALWKPRHLWPNPGGHLGKNRWVSLVVA